MPLRLTDHARTRLQQRGIPLPILDCLVNYGKKIHDHHGAEILYFDHHSRERIRRNYGADGFKSLEPKLDTYAVIASDGAVLTVGHRTKRINRH